MIGLKGVIGNQGLTSWNWLKIEENIENGNEI